MDILYKVLGKEVYIIVEHQSTVDQKMPERMGEYCLLLIKSREKYLEKGRNKRIPIILPIVLSTANREWNATTTLIEKEKDNCYGFPKQKYPRYKVINNYDYTIDELIEKRTGIGLVMAYEKVENREELRYIIKKQKEKGVNEREKNAMKLIVEHIEEVMPSLAKKLTEEEIKEIKEEMRKIMEGSDFMTNFEKALARIMEENERKVRAEGKAEGKTEGISQNKVEIAMEMAKIKIKDEDIIKCTHISKKELEQLKLQMA